MADQKNTPTKAAKSTGSEVGSATGNATKARHFRRKLVGVVTSHKMDKTAVVQVTRTSTHRKYKKYLRGRESYKAHDATNEYRTGDRVEIQEHRPISKEKRWVVVKMIRPAADREV